MRRVVSTPIAPTLSPRAETVLACLAAYSRQNKPLTKRMLIRHCLLAGECLTPILAALLEQGKIRAEDRGHAVYYWCGG